MREDQVSRQLGSFTMTRGIMLLAAVSFALSPTTIAAAQGQGSTNGVGWDHLNGPESTGQPGVECGEEDALFSPGHASEARGSAFNEDGIGHAHYAGEQPQNSRNTASISQYDVACSQGPTEE